MAAAAAVADPIGAGVGDAGKGTMPRFWAWMRRHPMWSLLGLTIPSAGLVWAGAAVGSANLDPNGLKNATLLITLGATIVGAFAVGWILSMSGGRLSDLVIGADERASTSKAQYLLWTVGIAFAVGAVAVYRLISGSQGDLACSGSMKAFCIPAADTWQVYIILLGVPSAAAVIAKATVTSKTESGQLQKTTAESAKAADLATNDQGSADLVDIQYLIFNLIAFGFFAVNFCRTGEFVDMPAFLVALTSASAAAYTANKAATTDRPVITSVSPAMIRPGDTVTLQGFNLMPGGTAKKADRVVKVTVGGREVPVVTTNQTASTAGVDVLTFQAPGGMSPQASQVVVTTSAGVSTGPHPVVIATPTILGWRGEAPGPGGRAELRVSGLETSGLAEVQIASRVLQTARDNALESLLFTVPGTLTPGSSQHVRVLMQGAVVAEGDLILGG